MKMKGEIRSCFYEVKECQRLPANHQKIGERHGTDSSSQTSGKTHPAVTLMLDFWPPKLLVNEFLLSHSVCSTLLWQP